MSTWDREQRRGPPAPPSLNMNHSRTPHSPRITSPALPRPTAASYFHEDDSRKREGFDAWERGLNDARRDRDPGSSSSRGDPRAAGWDHHRRRDSHDGRALSTGGRTPLSANMSPNLEHRRLSNITQPQPTQPHHPLPPPLPSSSSMEVAMPLAQAASQYHFYKEATNEYAAAEEFKRMHHQHFASYPALKERAEAKLLNASKKRTKQKEEWDKARALGDDTVFGVIRRLAAQAAQQQPPSTSAASSAEMDAMKNEMRALREREDRRDQKIGELENYFKLQNGKLQARLATVERVQKETEKVQKELAGDVLRVEELVVQEGKHSKVGLAEVKEEVKDRVTTVETRVQEMEASLLKLNNLAAKVETFETKINTSAAELQEIRDSIKTQGESLLASASAAAQHIPPTDTTSFATTTDFEEFKQYVNTSVEDAINMTANLTEKVDNFIPEITARVDTAQSTAEQAQSSAARAQSNAERAQADAQHAQNASHVPQLTARVDALQTSTGHLTTRLSTTITNLETVSTAVANCNAGLDALRFAVNQCNDKFESWSTRDFYDRLVECLCQRNPNWFHTGAEVKAIKSRIVELSTSFNQLRNENHVGLTRCNKNLEDHLAVFKSRMANIYEWTVKATQRLNENAKIGDEIQAGLAELRDVSGKSLSVSRTEDSRTDGRTAGTGGATGTAGANGNQRRAVSRREDLKPLNKPRSDSSEMDTND